MWLYYVLLGFLVFCIVFHFLTRKYINPYKLYFFLGKKGSGKSTVLTKIRLTEQKRGKKVFSNADVPGTYYFDPRSDLGKYAVPVGSVIVIDEVSTYWDNRKWKSMEDYIITWFRYQRQYKLTVYLFSQTFDVDVKIRNLADEMYLVRKKFRVFSIARRIDKNITIKNGSAEAPSTLAEDFEFVSLLAPNAIKITFIPHWTKYFESFNPPHLPHKDYTQRDGKIENRGIFGGFLTLFHIPPVPDYSA